MRGASPNTDQKSLRDDWTVSASGSRRLVAARTSWQTRRAGGVPYPGPPTANISSSPWRSDTERDIHVLSAGAGKPGPLLATRFKEDYAAFSPDGRWFAYVSNEYGRDEVYLRRFEGEPGRIVISANGWTSPRWSHDGRELYYTEGPRMMAVDVRLGKTASASRSRQLFGGPFDWDRPDNWDVSPDGCGFIMVRRQDGRIRRATLRVVVNWTEQLRP